MKTSREIQGRTRILAVMLAAVMVVMLGLFADPLSMISHAESQATVTASSAKIRKEPNTTSEVLGSAEQNDTISISSQTTGSDGYTWYQTFVNSETLGYIRSDLVRITDGTTPPTQAATTTPTTTTPTTTAPTTTTGETPVTVTAVNPISATVTGGQSVRVRANGSTSSQIVTTVRSDFVVTIQGQATGTDGRTWYQVIFLENGAEVTGFIRSDFITLSEELTPLTETDPGTEGDPAEEPQTPAEPATPSAYDVEETDGIWYLVVTEQNPDGYQAGKYVIKDMFESVTTNANIATERLATINTQKGVIIFLVILVIAISAALTYLIVKFRDGVDSAYFSQVEKETLQKRQNRNAGQGSSANRSVMPTVGNSRGATGRPTGAKPAGTGGNPQAAQGGKPAGAPQGARPAAPQGTRPAGTPQGNPQGARPAAPQGTRPAGTPQGNPQGARPAAPQGTRPAGAPQGNPQGARPAAPQGARPAGTPQGNPQGARPAAPQGTRPAGTPQGNPQGARPAAPQGTRPAGTPQGNPQGARPTAPQGKQNPGWQSKNFMNDDDEFEFEFLNMENEEEQ